MSYEEAPIHKNDMKQHIYVFVLSLTPNPLHPMALMYKSIGIFFFFDEKNCLQGQASPHLCSANLNIFLHSQLTLKIHNSK